MPSYTFQPPAVTIAPAGPPTTLQLAASSTPLVVDDGQPVNVTYSSSGALSLSLILLTGPVVLDPSPGQHVYTFTPSESSPLPIRATDAQGVTVVRPLSVVVRKVRTGIDPTGLATVFSVRSGLWDDPATWGGIVPTENDAVQVGHVVTISGRNNWAGRVILVLAGWLRFDAITGGVLHTSDLDVVIGSTLEMGTVAQPIAAGKKALIVLTNRPTHLNDTAKQWPGLRVRGMFTTCGQFATRYARLGADVVAGATSLDLAAPVVGWAPGQKIWLPDSRQIQDAATRFGEQAVIRSVTPDGLRVYLMDPVTWAHPSCYNPDDTLFARPHVCRLSGDNVGIIAEDPTTVATRGHVVCEAPAVVDLRNTVIAHGTGRTLNSALGTANPDDRLPFRLQGLANFNVQNCVSLEPHPLVVASPTSVRWGVTAKACTGGTFKDCMSFNWAGEGFALSNTIGVTLDGCFATRIAGTGQRGDGIPVGQEGSGFWTNRPSNRWRNCVAADCKMYGWILLGQGAGISEAITEFSGCELYSCNMTLTLWYLGATITTWVSTQPESVILNLKTWHPDRAAFFPYPVNRLTFDGWRARGSPILMKDNNVYAVAWYTGDYLQNEVIVKNSDIRGFARGITAPPKPGDSHQTGAAWRPFTIQDTYLQCKHNVVVGPQWGVTGGGTALPAREVFLTRLTHGPAVPAMGPAPNYELLFDWRPNEGNANLVVGGRVWITDRNGVPGASYRAYALEQDASFITPATGSGNNAVGASVAGQTNAQNFALDGKCVYGEITPAGAMFLSWTNGKVA